MPSVERWQTTYVRYKTQPEAATASSGWELPMSRRFAEKLAAESEGAFTEDTLLYNGLAPVRVTMKIMDAPAEYAVPVKQDRWGAGPAWMGWGCGRGLEGGRWW
jgi:hypothetical protein